MGINGRLAALEVALRPSADALIDYRAILEGRLRAYADKMRDNPPKDPGKLSQAERAARALARGNGAEFIAILKTFLEATNDNGTNK